MSNKEMIWILIISCLCTMMYIFIFVPSSPGLMMVHFIGGLFIACPALTAFYVLTVFNYYHIKLYYQDKRNENKES
ncbi:hypothetical protein [Vibrio phage phiKT1024]|nr:hypothetical protein [Vibrio phage phiKT1024]